MGIQIARCQLVLKSLPFELNENNEYELNSLISYTR